MIPNNPQCNAMVPKRSQAQLASQTSSYIVTVPAVSASWKQVFDKHFLKLVAISSDLRGCQGSQIIPVESPHPKI